MILIIAEKPSQAKEYANALEDSFNRNDGYFKGQKYFITWCFGHLIELEKDTSYRDSIKWDKSYLPLIPHHFKYCIGSDSKGNEDSGKKKQLRIIKGLMDKSDSIINGTDADREGELIFKYVYNFLNCKLPYKRLWLSSLTKDEINKAFNNLKPSSEFEHLAQSGYARAITDWLVGINATQSATLHFGNGVMLSIGRVQTTILKIVCERYLKNKGHEKTYKYQLLASHNKEDIEFNSLSPIYESETEINQIFSQVKNEAHFFTKVDVKNEEKKPPLLHSIDSLIVEANTLFSLSSKETLSIAQTLYEKKITSYPRTDSQYINMEGYDKLKTFISHLSSDILHLDFKVSNDTPKSVNADKIKGSHDAIVPTGNITEINSLSENELNVYKLILSKCLESFSKSAFYEKKTYYFNNNNIDFKTNSSQLKEIGYLFYSFNSKFRVSVPDTALNLSFLENENINTNITVNKIESKPLAIFTDATLTPSLTKIGKFLKEENPEVLEELKGKIDLSNVQIGTQATRPLIIEKLINIGFIEKSKNKILPTEKGLKFYEIIKDLKVSKVTYTAILEKELNDIAEGNLTTQQYYKRLNSFINLIVSDIFSNESKVVFNERETIGKCPKCADGQIIKGKTTYGCNLYNNGEGCSFIFSHSIARKKLTQKNVSDLLDKGRTSLIKGFLSKTDKPFDALLKFDDVFKVTFEFADKPKSKSKSKYRKKK